MPDVVKDRYTAAVGVRHRRHHRARRRAAAGDPHRRRRPASSARRSCCASRGPRWPRCGSARRPARRCGDLLREGAGHAAQPGPHAGASWRMAANAPMLIKATMVDGKPEVGILPTGQVTGVIDELPTVAELLARIEAEAEATLKRLRDDVGDVAPDGPRPWIDWRRGGVPGRGPGLARASTWPSGSAGARRRARVGRHPRGLRPAPRRGSGGSSPTGGRSCRGPRSTAAAARRCGSGCSSRRSTTGPAARSGSRRTASSCSRRRIFEFGTPEQQDRHPAAAWPRAEDLWCQGWSEPNAGSDLAGVTSRGPARSTAAGCSTARRPGPPAARSAPTSSACSAPTRQRAPQGPHLPPRPARHAGRHRARLRPARRRRGLRRGVLRRRVPRRRRRRPAAWCSASPRAGWAVAMATTGSERGLTLRSPGRFLATAERLVALASRARRRRRCAAGAATAWMHAEAYQLQTLATVTKLAARRQAGRRGEPHQAVVDRARRRAARDRARPARPRRRARRAVEEGLAVRAVRPDLRRHQRDPAQHRRRARPRTARG